MEASIIARLETLLARIQRLRRNLYPEGWDADPLLEVEKELRQVARGRDE